MADEPNKAYLESFRNPVVILTILILLSIFVMIGAAMFGIDNGFLGGMARPEMARGLITYLFAVVTIGIAVALVLSTLIGPAQSDANDARFQQAKEVLSLLLGIFGTIVGYYFGSEATRGAQRLALEIATPDLSPNPVGPKGIVTVRTLVRGGQPPIRFGIAEGENRPEAKDLVFDSGWIVKDFELPTVTAPKMQVIHIIATDGAGQKTEISVPIRRFAQD